MTLNFMLIDDNHVDLFINRKMIEQADAHSNIRAFSSAKLALNYLKMLEGTSRCQSIFAPDVIFLDIDMPEMNGFQFITAFNTLAIKKKDRIKIYILSSSTRSEDVQRAKKKRSCVGFINKPLTPETIENIIIQFKAYRTTCDYLESDIGIETYRKKSINSTMITKGIQQ
jgi:CheY-like chemotaxis protein